jgi:hypothetical protein
VIRVLLVEMVRTAETVLREPLAATVLWVLRARKDLLVVMVSKVL